MWQWDIGWIPQVRTRIFFCVTRLLRNTRYRIVLHRSTRKSNGLNSDQTIQLAGSGAGNCPILFRRIGFKDAETDIHYYFLTNNFDLAAITIADIYKVRWQIELFIKMGQCLLHLALGVWYFAQACRPEGRPTPATSRHPV